MAFHCAAVFGLGLIGGSIARDLAANGVRVIGYDANAKSLGRSLDEGSVHAAIDGNTDLVSEAEIVILAVPVDAAPDLLAKLAPRLGSARLITDVGSTKVGIARAASRFGIGDRFVGSHPLCGDHRSGWSASRRDLFQDAKVFICPSENSNPEALRLAADFWRALGANPVAIAPVEHDQMMSWVSHLPQLTATALALTLKEAGFARDELGPGGLEMTRLGGSSPEMWSAIIEENRENVLRAVSALIGQLEGIRAHLTENDNASINRRLNDSCDWSRSHIPCKGASSTRT